jgi:hypothetical protein
MLRNPDPGRNGSMADCATRASHARQTAIDAKSCAIRPPIAGGYALPPSATYWSYLGVRFGVLKNRTGSSFDPAVAE